MAKHFLLVIGLLPAVVLFSVACGDSGSSIPDGGTDAATDSGTPADGGAKDGGGTTDGGGTVDGGVKDGGGGTDYVPATIVGISIEFVEPGVVTNTWNFKDATTATLVGTGDFPYTYSKLGVNSTRIIFDVSGNDQYDMTWTSAAGGTFQESFNGTPGSNGTFTLK